MFETPLEEVNVLRTCAILHDIGKLQCWADGKPWYEHAYYTFKFVKACLGEELATHAMRHHAEPFCSSDRHPQTDVEKVICLANNLSGAYTSEELGRGSPPLPIKLTHILSESKVRKSLEPSGLAGISKALLSKLGDLEKRFIEQPKATYLKLFEILDESDLRFVPAATSEHLNDVSLWDHLKLTAAFATCIWLSVGYKGEDLSKYEFALIGGDVDRISSFINESRRLPDLRARSNLIMDATHEAGEFLSDLSGPECVLFEGGGSFLALVPKNMVQEALSGVKDAFEGETDKKVTITVSHVLAKGDESQRNFGEIWQRAQKEMRVEKSRRLIFPEVSLDEGVEGCDVCKVRSWSKEDEERDFNVDAAPRRERLCDACWTLREKGKGIWLNNLKDKNNFVACIRADGDDVGRILAGKKLKKSEESSRPSTLSTISNLIHKTCRMELADIILGFEGRCVFAGGDDLLAFVPGKCGLIAAKDIASTFRDEMADQCTMSVGVAIFSYRLPVYAGLEAANYLLSRAKECGKDRVAFAVAGATGLTEPELEKASRVRTWEQLGVILEAADFMGRGDVASSQLRTIASVTVRDSQKAEVWVKYLIGKSRIGLGDGKKFLFYLDSGLLPEAFVIHNLFKGDTICQKRKT